MDNSGILNRLPDESAIREEITRNAQRNELLLELLEIVKRRNTNADPKRNVWLECEGEA